MEIEELRVKRELLKLVRVVCPKCGEDFQLQLKEWLERVVWKCRTCRHEWVMAGTEKKL
jgi:ribosomal protein L37AE/L43A